MWMKIYRIYLCVILNITIVDHFFTVTIVHRQEQSVIKSESVKAINFIERYNSNNNKTSSLHRGKIIT